MEDNSTTFEEFVAGIDAGTIKYVIRPRLQRRKDYSLIKGSAAKAIAYSLSAASYAIPVVLIPLICFLTGKWAFMLGFLTLLMAIPVAQIVNKCSRPLRELVQMTLIWFSISAIAWFFAGLLSVFTFMILCFLYELLFCSFAILIFNTLVTKSLKASEEHFYGAIDANCIAVIRSEHVDAQNIPSVGYGNNKGVELERREAVKSLRTAAEEGIPEAQHDLGLAYFTGEGVEQDKVEGAEWAQGGGAGSCSCPIQSWHLLPQRGWGGARPA